MKPYTRQEVLASEFANLLQELIIPQPILEWLGDAVLASDRTEQAARAQTIKKLQSRYDQIQARIETMYPGQARRAILRLERGAGGSAAQHTEYPEGRACPYRLGRRYAAADEPGERVILAATAAERRRLLPVVVEKAAWEGGVLQTSLFEPFEILCHSN